MSIRLDQVALASVWRVKCVHGAQEQVERQRHLEEIGFLPGERVAVMAKGMPGHDPLVVRIGLSTFALRQAEAQCIEVESLEGHDHA